MATQQKSAGSIRVLVTDDHPAVRQALRDRIESTMDMSYLGGYGTPEETLRRTQELSPDVAVVDLALRDAYGTGLIQDIQARFPNTRVVVYSRHGKAVCVERAIRSGASGYVTKRKPTAHVIEAVRAAEGGDIYLSSKHLSRALTRVARGKAGEPGFPIDHLTDREQEIFRMLGEGYRLPEIQNQLDLAQKTAEVHRRRAKEKLGVGSVMELLQHAVQWVLADGHGMPRTEEGTLQTKYAG